LTGASITVAMPTCNGARHLREALAGIHAQDAAFDLVVSDDRSDDETLAIVRQDLGDRARISINSERLGLAGNWNRCVELGRTDWVAIFHQDDVMRPGHLAAHDRAIAHAAASGFRIGLVAGPVDMIDGDGRPVSARIVDPGWVPSRIGTTRVRRGRPDPTEIIVGPGWVSLLADRNPLRCSAVTTRKAAHAEVGGFDPSYRYAVDWDFWVRVARGWGLAGLAGPPTVAMRWHPESETHRFRTSTTDLDEQVRLLDAIHAEDGPKFRNQPGLRRLADRRLARAFLNRAHVALKGGDVPMARACLARSYRLSPGILGTIALDPRLAVQMAALAVAPERAGRWFARRDA